MRGEPSPFGTAFLAILLPASVSAAFELLAVWMSSGPEAPALLRAAGTVALTDGVLFALAGAVVTLVFRRPRPTGSPCPWSSVAAGLTVAHCGLFVLANGAAPRLPVASLPVAAALAAAAGTATGLLRWSVTRSSCSPPAILVEPPLLAGGIVIGYQMLRDSGIQPTSVKGTVIWLLAAGACYGAAAALRAPLSRATARTLFRAAALFTITVLVGLLVTALLGRAVFPALPPRGEGRHDVLLVVLDTTRSDHAPAPPNSRHPTPSLARLSAEGTTFTRAFSTSCWTLPAHGSLFTGLLPSGHGATWRSERLGEEVTTLAERFRAAGWRTAGFSANPWISPEFGFDQGFGHFLAVDIDDRPLRPWPVRYVPRLFDAFEILLRYEDKGGVVLASETLRFLAEGDTDSPAFVFLNLLEPHLSYDPPGRFLGTLEGTPWTRRSLAGIDQDRLRDLVPGKERSAAEIDGLRFLYSAEVAYADHLLGRILDSLDRAGRLDRTVVAVTSDHGENLGQHVPLDHQLGLWDTLVHVPLILRYPPRIPAGERDEALVSLLDVPGALLDLAAVESPLPAGPLLGGPKRAAVVFEYERPDHILEIIEGRLKIDPAPWDRSLAGIRSAGAKWIEASDGRHEAYDLMADPGETVSLFEEGKNLPPELLSLAADLAAIRKAATVPPAGRKEVPPMSEATRKRLRSLGYIR